MKKYLLSLLATGLAVFLAMPTTSAQYDDMYYSTDEKDYTYTYVEDEPSFDDDLAEGGDYYYYDDDYNSRNYANRINRFRRSNQNIGYYDPFYTNVYSPFFAGPGTTFALTFGNGFASPSYLDYLAYRDFAFRRRFNSFGSPFGFAGRFGNPYFGAPFAGRFGGVGGFGNIGGFGGFGGFGVAAGGINPYCPPGSYSTGRFTNVNTPSNIATAVTPTNSRRVYSSRATSPRTRATTPSTVRSRTGTPYTTRNTRASSTRSSRATTAPTRSTRSSRATTAPTRSSRSGSARSGSSRSSRSSYTPSRSSSSSTRSYAPRSSSTSTRSSGTRSSSTRSSSTRSSSSTKRGGQ